MTFSNESIELITKNVLNVSSTYNSLMQYNNIMQCGNIRAHNDNITIENAVT